MRSHSLINISRPLKQRRIIEVMGNKLIFQRSFFLNFIFPEFNNSSSVLSWCGVVRLVWRQGWPAASVWPVLVSGSQVLPLDTAAIHGRACRGAADNTHLAHSQYNQMATDKSRWTEWGTCVQCCMLQCCRPRRWCAAARPCCHCGQCPGSVAAGSIATAVDPAADPPTQCRNFDINTINYLQYLHHLLAPSDC